MAPLKIIKKSGFISTGGFAAMGLCLGVSFWAINNVIARGIHTQVPPMAVSFFRWVSALVFLTPFALKGILRDMPEILDNKGYLFLLSIPSVVIYNSFIYLGANFTTATNISLIVAAMPAMTLGLSRAINKERPGPVKTLGILVSLVGVTTIVSRGSLKVLAGLELNPGDLMILVSIFSWALYSVLLKKRPIDISPVSFLFTIIAMGTPCLFPFYLWELAMAGPFEVTGQNLLIFVYLGVCPSIFSYLLWNNGVRVLGPSTTSMFIYLVPVLTCVIAAAVLGESPSLSHIAGGVLIFLGLFMSTRN